jgi:hypothetical protein
VVCGVRAWSVRRLMFLVDRWTLGLRILRRRKKHPKIEKICM